MKDAQVDSLVTWITETGLSGLGESAILTLLCERLLALGEPLTRANVVIDTLHPVYQDRAFTWKPDKMETMSRSLAEATRGRIVGSAAHFTVWNFMANKSSGAV